MLHPFIMLFNYCIYIHFFPQSWEIFDIAALYSKLSAISFFLFFQ